MWLLLRLVPVFLSPFLNPWFVWDASEALIISNAEHWLRSVEVEGSNIHIERRMGICLTCNLTNVSL